MQQQVGTDNLPQFNVHTTVTVWMPWIKEVRASTRGDVGNADDNLSQCATYMYRIQEYEGNAGENLSMYNVCNT